MWNKHLLVVLGWAVLSVFVMWSPFLFKVKNIAGIDFGRVGMERIVQNFDGINFLVVAKTWYSAPKIQADYQAVLVGRKPLYFSAHYPGLPAVISAFDIFMSGPRALMAAIILSNVLLAYSLQAFFRLFTSKPKIAVWLSIIALFFPARMLSDRIVGSNEPLFMFFVLMSIVMQSRAAYWWSAALGALAVLTRSPGIILFGAYLINIWFVSQNSWTVKIKQSIPYLLIPLSLLGLWAFYGVRFGSFWAYFQVGGNINLYWPFVVFASRLDWVSGIWNEDLIYLFILLMTGLMLFWRKHPKTPTAIFGMLYGIFVMSIAHRDLVRYSLPIMPIILVGMAGMLENKMVKMVAAVMIIPIILYGWQFVLANYQPIVDWAPLL